MLKERDAAISNLKETKADKEGPGSLSELATAKADRDSVHPIRSKLGDVSQRSIK